MTNSTRVPRSGVLNIEYDANVLSRIEDEAVQGFNVGGLLLGSYAGDSLRIAAFEPAPCDPQTLGERIRYLETRARLSGQRVLGWYTSHKRSELAMTPEELSLHERFFPEPWQVALMLRPNPDGSMGAKFFLKEKAASLIPTSTPDGRGRPELVPQRPVNNILEVQPEPAAIKRRRGWGVWAALAGMAALSLGGVLYLRLHFPAPAAQTGTSGLLKVEAVHRNGNIEVTWDPAALGDSTQGRLDVQDGGIRAQVVLDNVTLMAGKFTYAYKSDVTGFRMRVEKADGSLLEGSTTYVAPNSVAAAPPPVEVVPLTAEPDPVPDRVVKAPPKETFNLPQLETRREAVARRKMEREERRAQEKELARLREKEGAKVVPSATQTIAAEKAKSMDTLQLLPQVKPQMPPAASPQAVPQSITQPTIPSAPQVLTPLSSQPAVLAPAVKPRLQLAGRWTLHRGSASRSPAVPESVLINVLEGNGSLQGTLDARYRSGQKREKMSFSFSGQAGTSSARFPWKSGDGSSGFIEFIRVPNSASQFEVVWYGVDSKQVFDEIVRKDK